MIQSNLKDLFQYHKKNVSSQTDFLIYSVADRT